MYSKSFHKTTFHIPLIIPYALINLAVIIGFVQLAHKVYDYTEKQIRTESASHRDTIKEGLITAREAYGEVSVLAAGLGTSDLFVTVPKFKNEPSQLVSLH